MNGKSFEKISLSYKAINAIDSNGCTLLYTAVRYKNIKIAKALLAAGADANAREYGEGSTSLHEAAYKGDIEIVKLLIAVGADKDARDNSGWTPLHTAGYYRNKRIVKVLLAAGANVDIDNYGITEQHLIYS
jgi:ankyrin repeat protein